MRKMFGITAAVSLFVVQATAEENLDDGFLPVLLDCPKGSNGTLVLVAHSLRGDDQNRMSVTYSRDKFIAIKLETSRNGGPWGVVVEDSLTSPTISKESVSFLTSLGERADEIRSIACQGSIEQRENYDAELKANRDRIGL